MARYGREVDWQATALSYERENGMLVESLFQFEAERDSALAGESAALEEVARLRAVIDGYWKHLLDTATRLEDELP